MTWVRSTLLTALAALSLGGGPAWAAPATAGGPASARTQTWSCDGSPGAFRMRFSGFRPAAGGRTVADVAYPDGESPLSYANPGFNRVTIQGRVYRVGAHFDFHLSANGRRLDWVSPDTGDPISCRRR